VTKLWFVFAYVWGAATISVGYVVAHHFGVNFVGLCK
jgi:hypothetical protein